MSRLRRSALALLALAGCGPAGPGPVKVMALVAGSTGVLAPRQVELTTVQDPVALKGPLLSLSGGAVVRLDATDPLQANLASQTDAERLAAVVKSSGIDVSADYVERDGVLWPSDFHTWNMVTAYRAFERAYAYFQGVYDGLDPAELRGQRLLYWAEVHLEDPSPLTDNALYLQVIKRFVVAPQQALQRVPVAMNVGILGHEYAHRAFHVRVLSDAGLHPALQAWTGAPFNLLRSLDEGLADFHAHGLTCLEPSGCQPDFLAPSVADPQVAAARDLSRADACLDAPLRAAFLEAAPAAWSGSAQQYRVGTLWAAALFQAGTRTGRLPELQRALLRAYHDEGTTPGLRQLVDGSLATPGRFTPEAVADALLAHLGDPELRRQLCGQLLDRLQLTCTAPTSGGGKCQELPHCPLTAAPEGACPTLGPP